MFTQEAHADVAKDEELRSLPGKPGWKMVSLPAAPESEGNPGGVATLTCHWLGLSHVCQELKGETAPGRAVMAKRQAPGQPAFFASSLRLIAGTGLGKENRGVLEKVGEQAARA